MAVEQGPNASTATDSKSEGWKRRSGGQIERAEEGGITHGEEVGSASSTDAPGARRLSRTRFLIWIFVSSMLYQSLLNFVPGVREAVHRVFSPFAKVSPGVALPNDSKSFLSTVVPIPCHSEDDDKRPVPLMAALRTGCISVGFPILAASSARHSREVLVSDLQSQLRADHTLQNLYLDPLASILDRHNPKEPTEVAALMRAQPTGVFQSSPSTSLTLLLEFNSPSADLFPLLLSALEPLIRRDWVTYWDNTTQTRIERPLTIVASGLADFEHVLRGGDASPTASTSVRRYIFFDAPLHALERPGDGEPAPFLGGGGGADSLNVRLGVAGAAGASLRPFLFQYNRSNSHTASTSYASASRDDAMRHRKQRVTFRRQMRQASERGLVSRYWGAPGAATALQKWAWDTLALEGVGLVSTDDLAGLAELDEGFWMRTRAGAKVRQVGGGVAARTELRPRDGDIVAGPGKGKFRRWDTGPGLSMILQSKRVKKVVHW